MNRRYFCKSNLYDGIRAVMAVSEGAGASGTNLDDLGDFRPGLAAAAERGIRHPFVEAGIDKAGVRALARAHGLAFAEPPAQPCLASRVETGLRIEPADMAFIDRLEAALRRSGGSGGDFRVPPRRDGVAVETGSAPEAWADLAAIAADACARRPFFGVEPYRRGSAFVKDAP